MRNMVNILPASYRRQQVLYNRALQWSTIIATVLLVGWCWHALEMREQTYLSRQLDALSREHAPTQTMLKQVVDMRRQLKELQQQEAVASELETQRNALTLLGVISNTAKKIEGRLRVTKMELTNFQNASKTHAMSAGPPPGSVVVTGVALDNPSVGKLVDDLQHAGIFTRVAMQKLKEQENKSSRLRDYEIRCEF